MSKAMKMTGTEPIEHSFGGLHVALFDEINGLRAGTSKPDKANATARLAAEVTRSAKVQYDIWRLDQASGARKRRGNGGQAGLLR